MADPICRWRNATPETVKLLVGLLPKSEMPETSFLAELKNKCEQEHFDYDAFIGTAYQLAVQIGLYYISDDGVYHPRFDHDLSDDEATEYVSRVACLYVSPNPYSKSMRDAADTVCLYDYFIYRANNEIGRVIDVKDELSKLYLLPIGNTDMIVNLMSRTCAFIKIDGQHLKYIGCKNVASNKASFFRRFGMVLGVENFVNSAVDDFPGLLRVGDVFSGKDGGSFTVVGVLPKIYRIKADDSGKIRTVPKTVVSAWYEFYKENPTVSYDLKKSGGVVQHKKDVPIRDAATRPIRDMINTGTEDDPYEHGYDGMLGSIARWLLDNPRTEVPEQEDVQSECVQQNLPRKDLVDFAVCQFAERRLDEDWVKLLKRDGYEGLHARYAAMNADALQNMTAAEFDAWVDKELWAASVFFCGDNLKKLSEADKKAVCSFISVAKKRPQLISSYFGKDAEHVNGVGPVIITEVLMKFHPLDYMSYNLLMLQGLKVLGLVASDKMPAKVTPLEYQRVVGPAGVILGKLTDAGVPRRFDEDESATPDFVTVNEFLWWCKEHREDILKGHWEKNMKTVIKKVPQKKIENFKDFITNLEVDVENVGLKYAPDLMKRFVCAQLAKPFVVLTGLSGSGKTKLAQAFTRWIGVKDTYKVVPVGADWTNSEKLLGYPNALDPDKYVLPDTGVLKLMIDAAQEENKDVPFFLILDEMNLSHVERYFADFLSAMESRETIKLYDGKLRTADDGTPIPQTLAIPDNLFVIGTMNVDETTYMFSPKVLDRAQVIEFRVSSEEMSDFLSEPANPKLEALNEKGAEYAEAFLGLARKRAEKKLSDDDAKRLHGVLVGVVPAGKEKPDGMFTALADLGAEFGYRSAIEIVTFVAYYLEASGYKDLTGTPRKECLNQAIDAAVLQKLLPKLHGSLNRLGPVLDALIGKVSKVKPQDNDSEAAPEIEKLYPLTYEKLLRMKDRVENNGFTSFAEA